MREVMRRCGRADSLVVVGLVRGAAVADFGRTVLPEVCSRGRRIGEKGLVGVAAASACAGQVRGQGSAGLADVLVLRIRASDGKVVWVRRTGLAEREESVTDVALDARGDAYILGAFSPQAAGLGQGAAAAGDDGSGSDVFGMAAARRLRSVGCDADAHGYPRCTLRSHSPTDDGSRGPTTAFLVKMAGDSRLLSEGSAGREGTLSVWGHVISQPAASTIGFDSSLPRVPLADAYKSLVLEVVGGSGKGYVGTILSYDSSSHQVEVQPPLASADILDGSSRLRIVLRLSGKVSEAGTSRHAVRMDGSLFPGSDDLYVGMLLRIRSGPGAGYQGIIGSYDAATRTASDFDPPTLPATPTAASTWQIIPEAPFTSRNTRASCSLPNDVGCGSHGVVWARTLASARRGWACLDVGCGFDTRADDARSSGKALVVRGGAGGDVGSADGVVEMLVGGSLRGFDKSAFVVEGLDEVGVHSSDPSQDDQFLISLVG